MHWHIEYGSQTIIGVTHRNAEALIVNDDSWTDIWKCGKELTRRPESDIVDPGGIYCEARRQHGYQL